MLAEMYSAYSQHVSHCTGSLFSQLPVGLLICSFALPSYLDFYFKNQVVPEARFLSAGYAYFLEILEGGFLKSYFSILIVKIMFIPPLLFLLLVSF